MKIAIEKFWCVKYYKAQPYNMEHTLCVCYNSVHDQVGRKIIKFVNDKYKISPAKRLEHVTPEELDSAFLLSKNAVLDEIYKDYREKFGKINDKFQNLLKYAQVEE